MKAFNHGGVRFRYPEDWTADTEQADEGWTVTLQSPETAFLLISLRQDTDDPAELAEQTLDALRQEYQELDVENVVESLAGVPAVGHDVEFLTLDTPVITWTRCLPGPDGVLLVLCQTSEYDRPKNEPILRAICASLEVEE